MARASSEDYYAILEVSPSASLDTIRENYKRLALRFHPDKNRDASATRDFQRLVDAWETLKDAARRREYNKTYVGSVRSRFEEVNRRRSEVDREATAQWNHEYPRADDAERQAQARNWKDCSRKDYVLRLQGWTNFRDGRLVSIQERQVLIRRNEADLNAQTKVPECEMIRQFQDAIERSRAIGHQIQDHAATLSRLLAARENYINTLMRSIEENQARLRDIIHELEVERQRYEEEEARSREMRVQEALMILGPRDLNPPLFSMIDRRGQAINRWKALSRVKIGIRSFISLEGAAEGPWHSSLEWERIGGEHICSRCGSGAYHIILECGPAKCPCCGMIVCNNCHRDLQLLREYDCWITGPADDLKDSFFALELGANPKPTKVWVATQGFNFGYDTSPVL